MAHVGSFTVLTSRYLVGRQSGSKQRDPSMLFTPTGAIVLSKDGEIKHNFGTAQGLREYSRKDKPVRIKLVKLPDGGGKMHISFASKNFGIVEFEEYEQMITFLVNWTNAKKAEVKGL